MYRHYIFESMQNSDSMYVKQLWGQLLSGYLHNPSGLRKKYLAQIVLYVSLFFSLLSAASLKFCKLKKKTNNFTTVCRVFVFAGLGKLIYAIIYYASTLGLLVNLR